MASIRMGGGSGRIFMGLAIAAFALISYCSSQDFNPVTGEKQYIALSPDQEIALGLSAVPTMVGQFGGEDKNTADRARVTRIGERVLQHSAAGKTDWQFNFRLLADPKTVNAFALPGGQVFITRALYDAIQTEGQLAAVLGHEIGHVVARHSAQQVAKERLAQGLSTAATVASDNYGAGQIAAMAGRMVNMRYGREDELQSDRLGVRFMAEAGYDPRSMLDVMKIIAKSGGRSSPEFFSTHPNPENRLHIIADEIAKYFPAGVPENLEK